MATGFSPDSLCKIDNGLFVLAEGFVLLLLHTHTHTLTHPWCVCVCLCAVHTYHPTKQNQQTNIHIHTTVLANKRELGVRIIQWGGGENKCSEERVTKLSINIISRLEIERDWLKYY